MNILSYKGYQGRFEYDPDADVFHGEVLHMADVVTFQGRSVDELREALADSVEDYLEFCGQQGKEPDKPYSGRFNVRIAPELHQLIARQAAASGKSLNNWVAEALGKASESQENSS
ncbi:MAG: type II toxin-antitoxin system HicB family antitoxin [Desulfovibrio sp.]|nr:MAG: type II toxin-antitoxin system HicB family antitoxin [Desulfovibrio sp.]